MVKGKMVELICWCDKHYFAREADLKRGWGFSCCKSHAAIKRDYGRSNPVVVSTGQCLNSVKKKLKPKRKAVDKRKEHIPNAFKDYGYGHLFADGDEGHGQS